MKVSDPGLHFRNRRAMLILALFFLSLALLLALAYTAEGAPAAQPQPAERTITQNCTVLSVERFPHARKWYVAITCADTGDATGFNTVRSGWQVGDRVQVTGTKLGSAFTVKSARRMR